MKLELYPFKRLRASRSGRHIEEIAFSVLDLDRANSYPQNFVCILPKYLTKENASAKFVKIYGENDISIAVKLLKKALKNEDAPEVKKEIESRLKALKPKPTTNCLVCGDVFKPKKHGRYLQTICHKCKDKGAPTQ